MRHNGQFTQADIDKVFDGSHLAITLDGAPARIMGRLNSFATLIPLDRDWVSFQFSWPCVFRTLAKGGAFHVE